MCHLAPMPVSTRILSGYYYALEPVWLKSLTDQSVNRWLSWEHKIENTENQNHLVNVYTTTFVVV